MNWDRRTFLLSSAAAAVGSALAWADPFESLAAGGARESTGYGPLAPVKDETTGLPLLRLPPGFRYASLGWFGDPMVDGKPTPPGHDGGAVFAGPDGTLLYVRNHELSVHPRLGFRRSFAAADRTYDAGEAPGGVTVVGFDPARQRALATEPLLSGTVRNCAGGPTPWGTWLTCEETLDDPTLAQGGADLDEAHGWVFEVPPRGAVDPTPIRGLGRMWHEAAAVDPATGDVYLTEDRSSSGLYRFRPDAPGGRGSLARGGRLEMLAVAGERNLGTSEGLPVDRWMDVRWVPVPDPERAHADPRARDGLGLHTQGLDAGGASFARGEGIWHAGGRIHFVATSGGAEGWGQVFELDPAASRLRLVFESPGPEVLNRPDNVCVSPRGGIVLCEDAKGTSPILRGLGPDGLFDLAHNDVVLDGERNGLEGDFRDKEWAGACFSPDGRWLFVSIQWPGITFAITGPWQHGVL
jgi:secreted PhoX family phosphatase